MLAPHEAASFYSLPLPHQRFTRSCLRAIAKVCLPYRLKRVSALKVLKFVPYGIYIVLKFVEIRTYQIREMNSKAYKKHTNITQYLYFSL